MLRRSVHTVVVGGVVLLSAGACSDSSTEPVTVSMVLVTPTNGEVQVGSTLELSVEARGANDQVVTNPAVTWRSDQPNVASVSSGGSVQGLAAGTARITATVGEVATSVDVGVYDLPQVETLAATDVAGSSGVVNGQVNPGGAATEWTFELGLTPVLNEQCTITSPPLMGIGGTTVSCSITGQPVGRTIFYRVVAKNKAGRAEGATLSFTTVAPESRPPAAAPEADRRDGDRRLSAGDQKR